MALQELQRTTIALPDSTWGKVTAFAFPRLLETPPPFHLKVPAVGRLALEDVSPRVKLYELMRDDKELGPAMEMIAAPFSTILANTASLDIASEPGYLDDHIDLLQATLVACNDTEAATGITLQMDGLPREGIIVTPEDHVENEAFATFVHLHRSLGVEGQAIFFRHFGRSLTSLTDDVYGAIDRYALDVLQGTDERVGYLDALLAIQRDEGIEEATRASLRSSLWGINNHLPVPLGPEIIDTLTNVALLYEDCDFPRQDSGVLDESEFYMQSATSEIASELGTEYDSVAQMIIMAVGFRRACEFLAEEYADNPEKARRILSIAGIIPYLGNEAFDVNENGSGVTPFVSRRTLQIMIEEITPFLPENYVWRTPDDLEACMESHEHAHVALNLAARATHRPPKQKHMSDENRDKTECVIEGLCAAMGFQSAVEDSGYYDRSDDMARSIDIFINFFSELDPQSRERALERYTETGHVIYRRNGE